MIRITVAFVAVALVAGCVQSEFIVMRNPATGELKECKTNSGASLFPIAQTMMDNSATQSCATGYQAAGWTRMN